jgi:hypothetical protein
MMTAENGGSAFPHLRRYVGPDTYEPLAEGGMTLRDWFAGQAPEMPHWWMQNEALATQPPGWKDGMSAKDWDRLWNEFHCRKIASWRFHYADAMLEARK